MFKARAKMFYVHARRGGLWTQFQSRSMDEAIKYAIECADGLPHRTFTVSRLKPGLKTFECVFMTLKKNSA